MARLYGRLREAFGYTTLEIDAMSMVDVQEVADYWKECPPLADVLRAHFPVDHKSARTPSPAPAERDVAPREVTEEEFARLLAESQRFTEKHGRVR